MSTTITPATRRKSRLTSSMIGSASASALVHQLFLNEHSLPTHAWYTDRNHRRGHATRHSAGRPRRSLSDNGIEPSLRPVDSRDLDRATPGTPATHGCRNHHGFREVDRQRITLPVPSGVYVIPEDTPRSHVSDDDPVTPERPRRRFVEQVLHLILRQSKCVARDRGVGRDHISATPPHCQSRTHGHDGYAGRKSCSADHMVPFESMGSDSHLSSFQWRGLFPPSVPKGLSQPRGSHFSSSLHLIRLLRWEQATDG